MGPVVATVEDFSSDHGSLPSTHVRANFSKDLTQITNAQEQRIQERIPRRNHGKL